MQHTESQATMTSPTRETLVAQLREALVEARAELEANAAEIGRLREALKLALTKVPHQSRCARLLPTSEWSKEKGNYDYSDCSCERHQIITALNKQESGNV